MNDELMKALNKDAVLRLWPETGKILQLTKGATYRAAMAGDIETVRFGRLMRVPTAWIKRKLGMIESGDAA